jgi:16S rRNA (cytosine967-C5)-methyltransferase
MADVSPARKIAFEILLAIESSGAHSDDLLRAKKVNALSPPDRNLVTALVLGVLRWQILLDQAIQAHLGKPNVKLDTEVRIALRLGAYQLLFLDRIPAHAAVDASVELAKRSGHRFAAGMVNAVLRKLNGTKESSGLASGQDFSHAETVAREFAALAPEVNAHPAWMVDRWTRNYGAGATCAICRYNQNQPQLSLRLADPRAEKQLTEAGMQLAPGRLLTAARLLRAGDVTATAAFREGRVRIQDEGSQLIAEIAASSTANSSQDQEKILDACAAPGGKTLILAERHPQARIVACEVSPPRLAVLKQRVAGFGGRIECRLADAAALGEDSAYDLVLADVSCSGTGTLGRNPEIRHRLREEDLPRQAERQRAILRRALHAVRPGGRVVYSTCSLEPEENQEVVAAVLAEGAGARQVSLRGCIEEMRRGGSVTGPGADALEECVTPEGALRLLPGVFGTDGFFVAVLEKAETAAAGVNSRS